MTMTDFIGVYAKLRDPQVSWEAKISIAENAWSDDKCFIPNKQQVLLDWVCQKLVDHILYKKDKRPVDGKQIAKEVKDLWAYFKSILQSISKPVNGENNVCVPLTLMPQLVQVFAKLFLDHRSLEEHCKLPAEQECDMLNIIHCGQMILSSTQLNTSFVTKFENYVMFMSSLLSSFVAFMSVNSSTSHKICNKMFCLLELSLGVYNSLQRKQTNHRKLFERTCGHILGPILTVLHTIKNNKLTTCKITQDRKTCFVDLLHRTLSDALFRRENLSDFLSTLKALKDAKDQDDNTDEPTSKRPCLGNYTKLLFDTLRNLLSSSEGIKQEALTDFLPQLYVEFLKARRENQMSSSSLEFDFFTELCLLLGIDNENMIIINKHGDHTSRILEYIYCLLDTILTFDVYQVGEDNANDGRQLKWFVNLTKLLLSDLSRFNVYPCLEVLLNLNHCIIVPHLNSILQWMFDSHETVQGDISSCDSFLSSVVKTYVKLRQFDRLISQMLESLRTTKATKSTWRGFPDLVREELIKACQSLPYGMSTSLWKTMNSEICSHYLPTLQDLKQQAETQHEQENKTNYLGFRLERVVGLFSLFLFNTTLGGVTEQHAAESTKRTLSSLYHESVADVLGPLWETLSNMRDNKVFAESLSVSVLTLFHALQEIKIFLGKLGCISDDLNIYWEKYIKGFLQKSLKTRKQGNERLKYLLVLVCIQRSRVLLIQDSSAHFQADFEQLLDHIFSLSGSISYGCPSPWNKQVWTINKHNFSVAYWDCLCGKASLLLPVCSDQQRLHFTRCLIQSMISTEYVKPALDQTNKGVLSMQSISKKLLQSAAFHLVPSMQDCLLSSLWTHIAELLSSFDFTTQPLKRLVNIVTALGTLQVDSAVKDDGMDLDKEKDIQDSPSEDESDEVSESEDEEDISHVVEITEKSHSEAVNPVLSLGRAFSSAVAELEASKGLAYQTSQKDLESLKLITNCLSVLGCLPLDWLTDVNHSACVIGLIACDTLLQTCIHQGESKEFHKALFLDHHLLNILVNGCISKKRFVIHHIINLDLFLSWMLSSYLTSCQTKGEENLIFSGQLESTSIHLFCTLLKYLLRTAAPASSVYSCINKMTGAIDVLTKELKKATQSSVTGIIQDNKLLLRVFAGVMKVLEKAISCKTSRLNEVRMSAKLSINMAPSLLNLLGAIAVKSERKRHSTKKGSSSAVKCLESILQQMPVLIDSYSAVIRIYKIAQTSKKLSQTKEEFQQLQWRPILPSILTFSVNSLQNPQEDGLRNATENLKKSCLHFLDVICLSLETLKLDLPQDFHCSLLASLLSFLNKVGCEKEENTDEMRTKALESILSLLLSSPPDTLVVLLKGLCNELTSKTLDQNSVHRISTCIHVWSMILSGRFPKLKKKELCSVLPQVLMALQSILQESSSNIDLTVLTVQAITKLLSLGTNFIQSHHCTLAFHGCLLVSLSGNKERFPHLFQAQYGLLSSILFHQSEAVYDSVHVFVTCVKNMLWSLSQHCDTKHPQGSELKLETKHQLDNELLCAQKMARLYQEIATHKTTFSKYAPYMITDYIQQIQQVSLQAHVKEALVPGVYCLLDMCGEHEMALLHAVLDEGSRELFNSLNNDYNKFHKFKGKV